MLVGFTALAYNTSLGGAERSQQREIVIKQTDLLDWVHLKRKALCMRKLKYTRIDTCKHLPNLVYYP